MKTNDRHIFWAAWAEISRPSKAVILKVRPLIIRSTEMNLPLHNVLLIGKAMNPFIHIMYHLLQLKIILLSGRN